MINNFLETQYSWHQNDAESACKTFTDIIMSAAKSSWLVSSKSKKSKQTSNKTWFDFVSKKLELKLQIALKEKHQNPHKTNTREKCNNEYL